MKDQNYEAQIVVDVHVGSLWEDDEEFEDLMKKYEFI